MKHTRKYLTPLERRLYKKISESLRKSGCPYLRVTWLKSRSKHGTRLLVGIGRYKPLSGDLTVTFETKYVKEAGS